MTKRRKRLVIVFFVVFLCAVVVAAVIIDYENTKDSKLQMELTQRLVVDNMSQEGGTPLHWAALKGYTKAMNYLLAKGADVNANDKNGETPLHAAAYGVSVPVVKILLTNGADINAKDKYGFTPLHIAAAMRRTKIIKLLLAAGANVNAKSFNGGTPLHFSLGYCNVVKYVRLSNGQLSAIGGLPVVMQQDWWPNTGRVETVKVLLRYDADINAKEEKGRTPLQVAMELGRSKEVIELLR